MGILSEVASWKYLGRYANTRVFKLDLIICVDWWRVCVCVLTACVQRAAGPSCSCRRWILSLLPSRLRNVVTGSPLQTLHQNKPVASIGQVQIFSPNFWHAIKMKSPCCTLLSYVYTRKNSVIGYNWWPNTMILTISMANSGQIAGIRGGAYHTSVNE